MKLKILAASLVLVVCFFEASIAIAKAPTKQEIRQYLKEYHQARHELGASAVGCDLIQGPGKCHVKATRVRIEKSRSVIYRMLHPVIQVIPAGACWDVNTCAPQSTTTSNAVVPSTPTYSTASYASGAYANVPGVPSSFASCVAFKESTNGKLSPNIYGLQSYYPGESLSAQKQTMSQMYGARGIEPWHPYDHCG